MFNSPSVATTSKRDPLWLWAALGFGIYLVAHGLLQRPHVEAFVRERNL